MTYKLTPTQFKNGIAKIDAIKLLRDQYKSMLIPECMSFLTDNLNKTQIVDKYDNHYDKLSLVFDFDVLEEIPDMYERREIERKQLEKDAEEAEQWFNTLDNKSKNYIQILIKANQIGPACG